MWKIIKEYWDLLLGVSMSILLTLMANFKLEQIQLYYSIIIMMLVTIGIFKIIKQSIDKKKEKRKKTAIDVIVDGTKPVKALNLAQNPINEGEKIGKILIKLGEEFKKIMQKFKKIMKKLKVLFGKYKGYILSIILCIVTLVEDYKPIINNNVFGGKLSLWDYEVIPVVTLVAAVFVGIISNGYTKEQKKAIKGLFATTKPNELVINEIKKAIKENEKLLKQQTTLLSTKLKELSKKQAAYKTANDTVTAKKEMTKLSPQLATNDDVQNAINNAVNCEAAVNEKKNEIKNVKSEISKINANIDYLKNKLAQLQK